MSRPPGRRCSTAQEKGYIGSIGRKTVVNERTRLETMHFSAHRIVPGSGGARASQPAVRESYVSIGLHHDDQGVTPCVGRDRSL